MNSKREVQNGIFTRNIKLVIPHFHGKTKKKKSNKLKKEKKNLEPF